MPTETLSNTPSLASCSASSPSRVAEIVASNKIVSPTSSRLFTKPIGLLLSWYIYILGFLPSNGNDPVTNLTFWPSDTTASTSYCTATPARVRRGIVAPAGAASKFKSCGISLSIIYRRFVYCHIVF